MPASELWVIAPASKGEKSSYWKTIADDYHWHIEILPIVETRSKSYSIKEVYYNALMPEEAAGACASWAQIREASRTRRNFLSPPAPVRLPGPSCFSLCDSAPTYASRGRVLVVNDPQTPADVIIVLGDDNYGGDRAFHAAELYRSGVAPVVVASGRMLRANVSLADLIGHDLESFGIPHPQSCGSRSGPPIPSRKQKRFPV